MVVAAILPISAFLLCFIHKVRGSHGCVNHSCVLVFALYKRYVVVAIVLNISAHSICFIQKVSGSRGYITHIRVSTGFALYTRYVVVAAVVTIAAFYCALYKRYVVVAAVLPMSASYISFYTKRIVCPPLLAIYLRPTISLIPKVCMNCNYTCELLSLYTKTTRSPLYYSQPSFPIYRTSMDAPTNTPQFTTFYIKIQYRYFYCYM